MVVIYFLLKGNTEVPRNPKQKFVSVDLLAFVTYSVLLTLCYCYRDSALKKSVHILIKRWWSVNKVNKPHSKSKAWQLSTQL